VVSQDLVAGYIGVTGDDNPLYTDADAARAAGFDGPVVPPGLAGVWARRAYLGHHRMLPGGVMAGQDIEFSSPAAVGQPLLIAATVVAAAPDDPKRRVVLHCSARNESRDLVAQVRIDARWPEGDR
jgi:acyl dehydratase